MATFTSSIPNLVIIKASDIQFINGSFTTEDARLVGILRYLAAQAGNSNNIVETVTEADPNISALANVDSTADSTNAQNILNQGL